MIYDNYQGSNIMNIGGGGYAFYPQQQPMFSQSLLMQTPQFQQPMQVTFNNPIHAESAAMPDMSIAQNIHQINSMYNPAVEYQKNLNQYASLGIPVPNVIGTAACPAPNINIPNMGGYYNNSYGYTGINPYTAMMEQEKLVKQQELQRKAESDIWKMMSRNVHKSIGIEIPEETLDVMYDPPVYTPPTQITKRKERMVVALVVKGKIVSKTTPKTVDVNEYAEKLKYSHLCQMFSMTGQPLPINVFRQQKVNELHDYYQKVFPDGMGWNDFAIQSTIEFTKRRIQDILKEQLNVRQLYKPKLYRELVSRSAGPDSYASKYLTNIPGQERVSVEDMEVQLPSALQMDYERRRAMFVDRITNPDIS